jgi:hypothetical protein
MSALKIGDRVGYSAAFLRSTGQFTGRKPFLRGTIIGIEEIAPGTQFAGVIWDCSLDPRKVNVKNIARVGSLAWSGV